MEICANIYATTVVFGLAIVPIVIILISPLKTFFLKMADKQYIYSMPIIAWLIFMSGLGDNLWEQILLWGAVVFFLLSYAASISLLSIHSRTD